MAGPRHGNASPYATAPGSEIWPLVSAATMAARDRYAVEKLGVPAELLMECAGRAAAEEIQRLPKRGPVQFLCGPGHNGGDGYVAARHLVLLGRAVAVSALGEGGRLADLTRRNRQRLTALGVEVREGGTWRGTPAVVVDALFGTGLARPLRGAPASIVRRINASRPGATVVALDLPSGLDAATGGELGVAVRADCTVTLGLPKLALAFEPGRSRAGRVVVAAIGIPAAGPGLGVDAELWRPPAAQRVLPARPRDGHKGTFGHVLLVAASTGKTGAAVLAAAGATRGGAGRVTIACPVSSNSILETHCVEAMTTPLPETPGGGLDGAGSDALLALAAERDVVAAGPGMGREAPTADLLRALVANHPGPLLLDADGLFPFRGQLAQLRERSGPTVLTPHPGEAGWLLERSARAINADRMGAARELAARSGAVVLLKGAGSVVADPLRHPIVNPTGGPNLGTGGTGDVLAGLIAALWAQGAPAREAAALGAWLHGAAGDLLARRMGSSGLLASQVADTLPELFEALRGGGAEGELFPTFASRSESPLALSFP